MSPPSTDPEPTRVAGSAVLDVLRDSARRFPTKTAMRRGPDALTYEGLLREIERRAERIDRIDTWVPLDAADPIAFVTDFFAARLARKGAVAHGAQIPSLLKERRESLLSRWRPARKDGRTIFFSSGSVGDGKPVPLGDGELLAAAWGYPKPPEIESSDRVSVGTSPAHVFGFVRGALHPLSIGAEVIFFAPRRDPLAEAEALGGNVVLLPGPLVGLSGRSSRRVRLRAVFSGGASLSEEAVSAVEQRGVPVRLGYGLTESAGLGSRQSLSLPRRPGTSGMPAAGLEISIVDSDSGADLPSGRTGDIRLSGRAVFAGYSGADAPNPFDARGRLDTGDLGYFDEQGELVVRGRREFCIVTQGRSIFAEEIESAIGEHPGVSEVAVAPLGESFAVLFVAREGASSLDAEIRAFLLKRLPAFARPRKVLSVEALPRNSSGKLDRRIISSWLA